MQFNILTEHKNASGVYIIRNTLNSKVYVGSTMHFRKRFRGHLQSLSRGRHHSQHLQNHFDKYGSNSLIFCLLEIVANESRALAEAEQRQIDCFESYVREKGFNNIKQVFPAIRHSDETKLKMAAATRSRPPMSKETREKLSAAGKGRPATDAQLQAVRNPANIAKRIAASVAKGSANKGTGHKSACLVCKLEFYSRPKAGRKYCSRACYKTVPVTKETRAKLASNCAHLHTPEVMEKIAQAKLESKQTQKRVCLICNEDFVLRDKSDNRKFCSVKCSSKKEVSVTTRERLSLTSKGRVFNNIISFEQVEYLRQHYHSLPIDHFIRLWGVTANQIYSSASRNNIKRYPNGGRRGLVKAG